MNAWAVLNWIDQGCGVGVVDPEANCRTMVTRCETAIGRDERHRGGVRCANDRPDGRAVRRPGRQRPILMGQVDLLAFGSAVDAEDATLAECAQQDGQRERPLTHPNPLPERAAAGSAAETL